MSLLSEIISKPVLNLYSGQIEGTIVNAFFDGSFKKIQYFKIFDDDEEEYLLSTNRIYSLGESCMVIKNSDALSLSQAEKEKPENNPINLEIYSAEGNKIGKLLDIELTETFEIKNFITENNTIKPEYLINIGKTMIMNNGSKKIKISDFKPKVKKSNKRDTTNVIKILPIIEDPTQNSIDKQIKDLKEEQKNNIENTNTTFNSKETFKIYNEPTPQRVVGNGNFLIGRKAIKTIYGLNNEIIIKKDNIINAKNLENAKKHSKLVELTVFSKIKT